MAMETDNQYEMSPLAKSLMGLITSLNTFNKEFKESYDRLAESTNKMNSAIKKLENG